MVLCVSAALFAWHDASFCVGQDIEFELHAPNTPGQPPIPGRIRGDTLEFDLTGNGKSIEYKRDITLDSDFHQGYRSARPDRRPLRDRAVFWRSASPIASVAADDASPVILPGLEHISI